MIGQRRDMDIKGKIKDLFDITNLKKREIREKLWKEINERLLNEMSKVPIQLHENVDLGIFVNDEENYVLFILILFDRRAKQLIFDFGEGKCGAKLKSQFVPLGKMRIIKFLQHFYFS